MKKISAILLAVVMLMSFAACGNTDSTNTTASTDASTVAATPAPTEIATQPSATADETEPVTNDAVILAGPTGVIRGTVSDNIYQSAYTGLTFEADSKWSFSSDSELAEASGFSEEDLAADKLQSTLATYGMVYDMIAKKVDADNILEATATISFVYTKGTDLENMSVKDVVALVAEDSGADIQKAEVQEAVYGGETYYQIEFAADTTNNFVASCKMDDVLVMIVAAATSESDTDFSAMFK